MTTVEALTRRQKANAIRALSMDAVAKANSGHPGMPMGMADIAEVLWNDFLCHNPSDPNWFNRDRFILSNGHGSMLQYALLHLSGYDLSMDEIKNFRQLHSKTPGHPEYGDAPGVETTTGPLGQGLGHAVGMALAEKHLAAQFNKPECEIVDHYTYVFCGDGCLMEGISHEVCSYAGTLGLDKLIVFYDDNDISIDGDVKGWYRDDTPARFRAYGWHVIENIDGHDADAVKAAVEIARSNTGSPTLICCKTVIGWGAPNAAGTAKCHGAPLGEDEIKATREHLNWQYSEFEIPQAYYDAWDASSRGEQAQSQWQSNWQAYQAQYPELAAEFKRRIDNELPQDWQQVVNTAMSDAASEAKSMASRKSSLYALNYFTKALPELVGGSADLTGSNLTHAKDVAILTDQTPEGAYLHYGVREFGMSAIMCGMALHGGVIPFGGTFLTFLDYARNAVRLSALMKQRVVYVFTHDSIGLGEDGPTHQPIEHIDMLRATPNVSVWRPADTLETIVAWQSAIERRDGPTALCLSRQTLPHLSRDDNAMANMHRGGYVLQDCVNEPECVLIATGSEVGLALEAAAELNEEGIATRVVSMPSTDVFDAQPDNYREQVLPSSVSVKIAIEAGSTQSWYRYVGLQGRVIGIDTFGASAPANVLFEHFGFTKANVVQVSKQCLNQVLDGVSHDN